MKYTPENQYRCTIIRGKSQTDMEDLLPYYANMVDKFCPCEESKFQASCCEALSMTLFKTKAYDKLSDSNKKTVRNHLTEIAGTLLGLYYPVRENEGVYIYKSETCQHLLDNNDYPTFFKNLCLNYQFPNGEKKSNYVEVELEKGIHIKPFCYVVNLLYYAEQQSSEVLLEKQEIGYYVLNNLDVLQGSVPVEVVYDRILADRKAGIKHDKLSGSNEWQHIKEQFNLLELAQVVEMDKRYIWLNSHEAKSIELFIKQKDDFIFDAYSYPFNTLEGRTAYMADWRRVNGKFHHELDNHDSATEEKLNVVGRKGKIAKGGTTKSTVDIGDEGEALVFRLEQERVRNYKERLFNKVLMLGKTKGLGYDIASVEADEYPKNPEMGRFIEVKTTVRTTEPNFSNPAWLDSLNLTAKEWVAAEQYGNFYNIYRVYITKKKKIVVRINNPYKLADEGHIDVYPTIYQMNFNSSVIEKRYDGE